ncbi:hypothetical protein ACHQM5_010837 [Ranunculus cassubicifolius]
MSQENVNITVHGSQTSEEIHYLASSGTVDAVMLKQILDSHDPNGHGIDVKTLFNIIEQVLQPEISRTDSSAARLSSEECGNLLDMISANSMHKISKEISTSSKCSVELITVGVCKILSSYTWYEKVVVSLANFVVNYGEFWLVARLFPPNQLAYSISKLNHTPEVADNNNSLIYRIDAIKNLTKTTLDISKCILEFKELPPQYISPNTPLLSNALKLIPNAVYWAIKGAVACSLQMEGLIKVDKEFVTSSFDAWEVLSNQTKKVNVVFEGIRTQLNLCYAHINSKKEDEAYRRLKQLDESIHLDNTKVLRALLSSNDDVLPLFDGFSKKKASLESFVGKYIILLVTDINIPENANELTLLEAVHSEQKMFKCRPESNFDIVWLPVMERSTPWNDEMQKKFEKLRNAMPWYSVINPTLLDPAVIRYIKEVWKFNKQTILVVMDPQGRIVHQNAFHMLWIWGSFAFPFTYMKEEALWQEYSWDISFVIDGIDLNFLTWVRTHASRLLLMIVFRLPFQIDSVYLQVREERLVCLYGGENMEWIRKFTAAARAVSQVIHTPIELMYVGKSNPGSKAQKIVDNIIDEKLSYSLELTAIWFFWTRVESMYYSKMQLGKTFATDIIMKEVMTMLSLNSSEDGWALFSKGSSEMVMAKGDQILNILSELEKWKEHVGSKGFVPTLAAQVHPQNTVEHCVRLLLSQTVNQIPDKVVCAECGNTMEKLTMFRCCTDIDSSSSKQSKRVFHYV